MARLALPSRLELKRPAGSASEAPLAKVIFTTFLYVSPVQMIPACDHTGTPAIEFDGFRHFTSSTTSGSASRMSFRIRASVLPRQSLSSLIRASISWERESPPFPSFEPLFVFFMFMVVVAGTHFLAACYINRPEAASSAAGRHPEVGRSRGCALG